MASELEGSTPKTKSKPAKGDRIEVLKVLVLMVVKKMVFYRQASQKEAVVRRISSIPLSAKERIDVVEILGQKLVLGVAQGGISLLLKLNDESRKKGEPDEPKDQTAL